MSAPTRRPKSARERGKIAPIRFAHAVMRTRRYSVMIEWYRTVLEAEPVLANDQITLLTYDDEHHRIAIVQMPGMLPRPRFMAGVEHIAYTYAGLGDLLATYKRLTKVGIRPYWCINHGGTTSMYYSDPDGNQVELQIDNFASAEELDEFLYGPGFQINPIGIDFDAEELCRRFDAGEPLEDLVRWKEFKPRGPESVPTEHIGRLHSALAKIAARLGSRKDTR